MLLGEVCEIIDCHWIASAHLKIAMSDRRVKLGTYGKQLMFLLISLGESNLDHIFCLFFYSWEIWVNVHFLILIPYPILWRMHGNETG